MGPVINSTDPDLSNFKSLGGKLIMYHGWADPLVNPRNSINYYESVAAKLETGSFLRLFMVPGMDHCASRATGRG